MEAAGSLLKKSFPFKECHEKECEQCGSLYKLYETPKGVLGACKHCMDHQLLKELNVPTKEERERLKEKRFIATFERVTHDLKEATIDSYIPTETSQSKAKEVARQYVKTFDGVHSLLFSGSCGLGKSHLSFAITKELRQKGYKTLYIKVTDLFDFIKNTYKPNSNLDEMQIFKMADELDLLVLDDIGSEYVKANEYGHESWASDVLYKIFDMRLNKSVICSTNYSEKMLTEKYGNHGGRIIDRMMDLTKAVRLEGESYRRKERF
ncbi:DNA replication protein DnaC [Lentibacillus sp. JNUCC-1]|uniref:ATP-binding protein n=1 Tax=Lentibacillus sp. JNUCC-1 TaxID=2654513 RepID=UPI0012E86A90|nr:ATP-binding protein [Lentibacillus sp. JNUCC-1]MUV38141.1 DNA replication protein DnaC [Lentibacillus sp. JNUCC-1]MUV38398.1 DNA replication protein DnaC [Lentibacillus sp. JNUCC-1]